MRATRLATGIAQLGLLTACGVHRPPDLVPRPASGLPDRFVPDTTYPPPIAVSSEVTCTVRLMDPRDGTHLQLVWSDWVRDHGSELLGDYRVDPPGRFGLGKDELLRLVCSTRTATGIVPGRP